MPPEKPQHAGPPQVESALDPRQESSGEFGKAGRLRTGARLVGRFAIRRPLGAGAMGEVYEALDEKFGNLVALKTLPRLDGHRLLRFKREFRAIADFRHPGLVGLGELTCDGELWFFTMELVRGVDWVSYARRGELELRRAVSGLADALTELHAHGRVHRDLKPSNVLVEESGRVVVLDFGLVRDAGSAGAPGSFDGAVEGTPHYMAPEQASGSVVAESADMYSAGVMLYRALTGKLPIEGSILHVMFRKQSETPAPPRAVAPDAPEDLAELAMRLLAVDPTTRPRARDLPRVDGSTKRPSNAPRGEAPFFGRESELEALRRAFDDAKARPVSVVVEGESGLGKSSLVREFVESLSTRDAFVFASRCLDRENVPFKVIDGAIDAIARELDRMPDDRARQCLPSARVRDDLLATFPVLRGVPVFANPRIASETPDRSEQRRLAFEGLRDLVERLGSMKPVVFVVDDLQWADKDSDVALEEMLLPRHGPPALWIFTSRGDGASRIRRATPHGDVRSIALGALDPVSASKLARSMGASAEVASLIAKEASGHPMFIAELARAGARAGVAIDASALGTLDDAILRRVRALDARVRALVEIAVVAGIALPDETAFAAAGLDPDEGRRAFSSTSEAGLLRRSLGDGGAIEPYHDRVRETMLGHLDLAHRRALHASLADALSHAPIGARRPDSLATHLLEAGRVEEARRAFLRAARSAAAATGFDAAVLSYGKALELGRANDEATAVVLEELGHALLDAGHVVTASERMLEAAAIGDMSQRLRRRREAGLILLDTGDIPRGRAVLEPILESYGERWPTVGLRFYVLLALTTIGAFLRAAWMAWTQYGPASDPRDPRDADTTRLLVDVGMKLAVIDPVMMAWFAFRSFRYACRAGDATSLGSSALATSSLVVHGGIPAGPMMTLGRRCVRLRPDSDELAIEEDLLDITTNWHEQRSFAGAVGAWERLEIRAARSPGRFHTHRRAARDEIGWFGYACGDFRSHAAIVSEAREAVRRGNPMDVVLLAQWTPIAFASQGNLDELASALAMVKHAIPKHERSPLHDILGLVSDAMIRAARDEDLAPLLSTIREQRRSILRGYVLAPNLWSMALVFGIGSALRRGTDADPWSREASDLLATYRRFARTRAITSAMLGILEAYVALSRGDERAAIATLDGWIATTSRTEVHGLRLLATHLAGRIRGGEEGTEQQRAAEDELRRRGARDPRTLCSVMTPHPSDPKIPIATDAR